jgi:hypothetical protein
MIDIPAIITEYIEIYDSVDIAESEFKKNIHEDAELRTAYRQWCHEVGSTEKKGFFDYCEEYLDNKNDIWDTLSSDYDE